MTIAFPNSSLISNIECEKLDIHLQLVKCNFDTSVFNSRSFLQAGVPLPNALKSARPKRQAEFLAGRHCARIGLRNFGIDGIPEQGVDRAPIWPDGSVGSLSHNDQYATALIGLSTHWRSVGIDIESWFSFKVLNDVAEQILTKKELLFLRELDFQKQIEFATRAFSVKESLFKALYPLTGRMFYFQDAALECGQTIRLLSTLSSEWQAGAQLSYCCQSYEDHLLSYLLIPASSDLPL